MRPRQSAQYGQAIGARQERDKCTAGTARRRRHLRPVAWAVQYLQAARETARCARICASPPAPSGATAKYGPRGYRLALFDVGHVSQNLNLCATALGLEVCAIAGFVDEAINSVLGLDGLQTGACKSA